MKKFLKISSRIVAALLLAVVFVPLLCALLLEIPAVQNAAVRRATEFASEKLGTKIGIEGVSLGLLYRARVDGFYVEDFRGDTLLYASRVDARLNGLSPLVLGSVRLQDGVLNIRKEDGLINIKELINKIRGDKPKKGGFKMRINRMYADGVTVRVAVSDLRNPGWGVDYGDMWFNNIRAAASAFEVDGKAVRLHVDRVSYDEPSGFVLSDLVGGLYVNEGLIELTDIRFQTPKSDVRIPSLTFTGETWQHYKAFTDNVAIEARVEESTLSSEDVAHYAPPLRGREIVLTHAAATMSGPVRDFTATVTADAMGGTHVEAEARLRGVEEWETMWVDSRKITVMTTASDVAYVLGSGVSGTVKRIVAGLGRMKLEGNVRGTLDDFQGRGELRTAQGVLQLDGRIDGKNVKGRVQTGNFQLGRVVGINPLGRLTMTAGLDGVVDGVNTRGKLDVRISTLEALGYAYHNMELAGNFARGQFDGRMTSRDENMNFDFEGLVSLLDAENGEVPTYDFTFDLHHADLTKTHINKRDTTSTLAARLRARFRARAVDDVDGVIEMTGARYTYNDHVLATDTLLITGRNDSTGRYFGIRSEYLDARYEGRSTYKEVWDYLRTRGRNYLPTWSDYVSNEMLMHEGVCRLAVDVKRVNPIADAILPGLMVADGSSLDVSFNPTARFFALEATSDYIEHGRMLFTRVDVDARSRGDSLQFAASTEDMYVRGFHLNNVSVVGAARENDLNLTLDFAEPQAQLSAHLGARALFDRRGTNRTVKIYFSPSTLTSMGTTWNVAAREIAIAGGRIAIDRFRLTHDEQELTLDGVASRVPRDSIHLTLRNFDLKPLSAFTAPIGYTLDGHSSGYATMYSALADPKMTADIRVDSLTLNERYTAPNLYLRSRWDARQSLIGMRVVAVESRDTLAWAFYSPSQRAYYARATLKNTPVGVIDPLLEGVMTDTRGTADVDVMVDARTGRPVFTGSVTVHDFSTAIDYTKVRYRVPDRVMTLAESKLRLDSVTVYDPENNEGLLSLEVDFGRLPNISYQVGVVPRRLMVFNTTAKDNDLFYGRIYASGRAAISGDNSGVRMYVEARTEDNSSFFMPLSSKSNISNVDFVSFKRPELDTLAYATRLRLIEERLERVKRRNKPDALPLEIDLLLDVRDNTAFQIVIDPTVGDVIKGRGNGQLDVRVNTATDAFEMYGDYTLTEGNYLFTLPGLPIASKRFTLDTGSAIQWTGEPLEATLDIMAKYHMKASLGPLLNTEDAPVGESSTSDATGGYRNLSRSVPVDCGIHIGGRLSEPVLDFTVDVPVSDPETQEQVAAALQNNETKQFVYLVFFGGFAPESMMSGGTGVTAATGAATGLELVTNMVTSWLSTEQYSILFNYKPSSETTNEELDFGFSTNLVDNRLLVEVEGNYVVDNRNGVASENTSTFNGAANVTWLIDKSGNLRLRAFTQTIDRFDENQGLQESGLGVSYREDFNDFQDLRERTRNRFAINKEERQLKRIERKEKRENRKKEKDSIKFANRKQKNLDNDD